MNADQIALQLYTVRDRATEDMIGTLNELARIGYRAVELAGYHATPVAEIRTALDANGMRAMGAHVPFADFENRSKEVISELQTLGCEFAVIPSLASERRGVDHVGELAKTFNEWGALCQEAGLRFGYHNHAFEFELTAPAGETFYDLLVEATSPAVVSFELDIYWAQYAGVDPMTLLQRHAARIPLLHVKDMARSGERVDAPVGEGAFAWPGVLEAAGVAGIEWYIVEQDTPKDSLVDVATSLRNLERMAEVH